MKPKALIWDMDGTLIDSGPAYIAAMSEAISDAKLKPIENLHALVFGLSDDAVHEWLCREHGLSKPFSMWVRDLYGRYLDRVSQIRPMPGALELWSWAAEAGLKQAVASNADRIMVNANLMQLGIANPGLVTVSRNDVFAGKPNPEMYYRAAYLLDVDPSDAFVLEDSPAGARAGIAAGMRTFLIAKRRDEGLTEANQVSSLDRVRQMISQL